MNIFRTILLLLTVFCLSNYSYSQEIVLYGIASESCDSPGTGSGEGVLYLVDPNTGDMDLIGPTGFDGVTALALLDDGRLLATGRQGADSSILIEINTQTGDGTLIGVIGDSNNPGECGRVAGLTYDSATDTLFGIALKCGAGLTRPLITLNPDTAELTVIGEVGFGGGGNALAVRDDGTLFASHWNSSTLSLRTLDRDTGAPALVGTMDTSGVGSGNLAVNGLDFHPVTQELFASSTDGDDPEDSWLVTIDESAPPSFNIEGQTLDCFDGLVFAEVAPSGPIVIIPTMGQWGMIIATILLGFFAIAALRRRRES